MSVLVYIEPSKDKIKKANLEAVSYAAKLASSTSDTVTALVFNGNDAIYSAVAAAGADKILTISNDAATTQNIKGLSAAVAQAAEKEGAKVIITAHDNSGQAVSAFVAGKLKAGIVAGAIDYATASGDSLVVKKNVFSGKATATVAIKSATKVISVMPNSVAIDATGKSVNTEDFAAEIAASDVVLKSFNVNEEVAKGGIPLGDADIVVSGGRGLKGPENWGIIEDLAHTLGAATACSRPVADADWRPHHEHVGQTGLAIRPNLYIAIGISGAIQHLAGVNGSKKIVVINTDPEAPFFKNADYGIVGDAFTVVPKLTEAIKSYKASH